MTIENTHIYSNYKYTNEQSNEHDKISQYNLFLLRKTSNTLARAKFDMQFKVNIETLN